MATSAPLPYYIANPDDEQQQYSPAVRALAGTGAPPQQSATPPAPQGAVPAVPTQPMPQAPAAPQIDMNRYQQLEQAVTSAQQPVDRNANKPRWYERLAGGLVGAGVGYNQGATAGINAGSAITNARYTQAQADQAQRAKAAQTNLDTFDRGVDMQGKNYGIQSHAYENSLQGRRLGDEEGNDTFQRNLETSNAKREQTNSDREFQRNTGNDTFGHQMQRDQFTETKNQHATENKNEGRRLGMEGARVGIEKEKAERDRTQAKGDVLRRGVDANKLNTARQSQLDALEKDDPKSGEPGYRSTRNSLMLSKKNPDTGSAWKDGEKQQAVAALDSQHADEKNKVEQSYAQGLQNLGYSAVPVTYGPDGKTVVNDSDGAAPGAAKQQAAAAAPQQAAPAAQPKQGRAPTPAGMVRMKLPDGREMFFPKANQAAAQKRGAQIIGE